VDGQKVWTSSARTADFGILLARTSPDKPKHKGLTYFLVDMRNTPGIDIRPLRELTGDAVFNEVFLDGVELPAESVVGEVDGGWRVARHTLGNERVHMADASPTGGALARLLAVPGADRAALGRLVADEYVLAVIDLRTALSSLDGLDPGAGGSIRKLVSAPHAQRVAEFALELCGPDGAVYEGPGREAGHAFLMSRCLTIAGGTTQVQLNVVAERILGLPRDQP
jgi:alkylation response protein AidB-like acyl-CoA dehydrogenase